MKSCDDKAHITDLLKGTQEEGYYYYYLDKQNGNDPSFGIV